MQNFFKNKNILITGHTGFKGTWLSMILLNFGANVSGYSLEPEMEPNLYQLVDVDKKINSIIGDIRDFEKLKKAFDFIKPEIVIHLAAQPLVVKSYEDPRYTYETNIMGTINILECIRTSTTVKSFINVTTDKVYKNNEWIWGYREIDELNGFDPYSNSKSCSDLITGSYMNSFFKDTNLSVATARAGNVIGGGDFSENRIIPDCIRSILSDKELILRNPNSIRPYQHVLEPLFAYLLIVQKQFNCSTLSSSYNVGPIENGFVTTEEITTIFSNLWKQKTGKDLKWKKIKYNGPHEAQFLKLDCTRIISELHWSPVWSIEEAIQKTIDWVYEYKQGNNIEHIMNEQIFEYYEKFNISLHGGIKL